MFFDALSDAGPWRRSLRLQTLVRIRWLAVAGQASAIVTVYWVMGYSLPIAACLLGVAASAWLNIFLRLRYPATHRLTPSEAGAQLAWDILQLAFLLFLTGGLQNPFAFLFLGPVLISATSLPQRTTMMLGVVAVACAAVVSFLSLPLPWDVGDDLRLPPLYILGVFMSLIICLGFIGLYAWQVSEEARQLADALNATELILAREQHLTQLDGLAAAAAHELGTPLATIALVTKELSGQLPKDGPIGEDMTLLAEQIQRCRDIMAKLKNLKSGDAPFDVMPVSQLLDEAVQAHRYFEGAVAIRLPERSEGEPVTRRNPGLLYGLGNLVENAVDFARAEVTISTRWDEATVAIRIADDGPGFAAEIMDRIGEPYLTRRGLGRGRRDGDQEQSGLGLGVFIAKTLLERTGASVTFRNRVAPESGAIVDISWPRPTFSRAALAGEDAGRIEPAGVIR